jgi:hypothetical protein
MANLPQQLSLDQMQPKWASQLNPIISNPLNSASILKSVSLKSGANVINHKLGQNLQGWYPVRIRGVAVSLYDTQDTNPTPQLTLTLNASAAVVVDLAVF